MTVALTLLGLVGCDRPTPAELTGRSRPAETTAAALHDGPLTIQITGRDYRWHIRYPGADGRLLTDDDRLAERHLHLPANTAVEIELTSADYLYTFKIKPFKLKEIAVPDLTMRFRIPPSPPTTLDLLGDQMCGYAHPELIGQVVIQSPAELAAWLAELPRAR